MVRIEADKFNWDCNENIALLNPRTNKQLIHDLHQILESTDLKSHVFLASSGTSNIEACELRWIALSKGSILSSANSVNKILEASSDDIWINVLPNFHIGGLAIWARAFLSKSKVIDLYSQELFQHRTGWNPRTFLEVCNKHKPTLCSLVPTQLYDLVELGDPSPPSLRGVFIGGDALSHTIYRSALELGWKLILTYGMTEASSQIATSAINSNKLFVLPHLNVRAIEKRLHISGSSIFSGYLTVNGLIDPKVDGWFESSDLVELTDTDGKIQLNFLGRASEHIKISGELVSLVKLDRMLEIIKDRYSFDGKAAIFTLHNERLGNVISLAIEEDLEAPSCSVDKLVKEFNNQVLPFERIQVIKQVELIPYNDLGKLQRLKLKRMVENSLQNSN